MASEFLVTGRRVCGFVFLLSSAAAFGQVRVEVGGRGQRTEVNVEAEILTRGPIHEAFAQTVDFRVQREAVARQAPPPPIEELAPSEYAQVGNSDAEWIPGYWAWD